MRSVVLAVASSLLVVGCAGSGHTSTGASPSTASGLSSPEVVVHAVHDAPKIAAAVSVGDVLVAQNWVWDDHPFSWSDDGGRTWHPSAIPTSSPEQREQLQLVTVGTAVFVLGNPSPTYQGPPSSWWSTDAGRSFHAATGVDQTDEAGAVSTAAEVHGRLVGFGMTRPAGPPTPANLEANRAVRWESDDQGKTWKCEDLSPAAGVLTSVVAAPDGALIALTDTGWAPTSEPMRTTFVRSTDEGRTWKPVPLPEPEPDGKVAPPKRIGQTVYATAGSKTWSSTDSGEHWTELGPAPVITDSKGDKPKSSSLEVLARSKNLLVAQVDAFFNNDHYLAGLAWSDDDGAQWHAASLPVKCTGYEASASIKGVAQIKGLLVATVDCGGGRLLISNDRGKSWSVQRPKGIDGMSVSAPVLVGTDHVSLWAGKNAEAAPEAFITVTPAGS